MGSVGIERMNVPHRSKIDGHRGQGSPLEEIYAPMISNVIDLVEPEGVLVVAGGGYFDIHPEAA